MKKERYEEIIKIIDNCFAEEKTSEEITKLLRKELSEKEFTEFTNLFVRKAFKEAKKILERSD